jgi:hypothetical protein
MWKPIRKVIGPPSLLHTTHAFADHILYICAALTAKPEAATRHSPKRELLRMLLIRLFRLPRRRVLL